MANIKADEGTVKVAIAPTWILQDIDIKTKDEVEVKGHQGAYDFIACSIKDKTTGFNYNSKSRRCR